MRTLILTGLLLFIVLSVSAQGNKLFLALSGGPSLPVGDYQSKSLDNEQAGLAKTGYNLNLHFGYQAQKNFGITSNLLYTKHSIDESAIHQIDPELSADHYQYYGITVGPMVTVPASDKILFDFKVLGGITNVNFPVISYQNAFGEEKWGAAFTWQLGTDLRFNFGKKTFLIANLDYTNMKPKMTVDEIDVEQKMSALDINVGIGFNF